MSHGIIPSNSMRIWKLIIYFVFVARICFIPSIGMAQSIHPENVHFRIIEDRIEVFYDLPAIHDSIHVKIVFHKKSDPKFRYVPQFASGDIGIGTYSGPNRKIVWYYKKEPPSVYTGDGFYFEIKAKRIQVKQKVGA
jgi:hypothetical protein